MDVGSAFNKGTKDGLLPSFSIIVHNLGLALKCAPHCSRVIAAARDILSTFMEMRKKGTVSAAPVPPTRPSKKSPRTCHLSVVNGTVLSLPSWCLPSSERDRHETNA